MDNTPHTQNSGADLPFWKTKNLAEMTPEEWESLCDGCAKCCLFKLQFEDSGEIAYTNVVCRFLDKARCRCTVYSERTRLVPTCLKVTPENIADLQWMPKTCAYRLIAEGKDLEPWHPLVSGDPATVHQAGISIRGKTIDESLVDMDNELEDYIIEEWE